eukprot:1569238-Rhodomonas_salina.1
MRLGQVTYPIRLCACYAMSGIDRAYGAVGLRARYAMSGTDLPYGATRVDVIAGITHYQVRRPYAMSGTGLGSAMRRPLLA